MKQKKEKSKLRRKIKGYKLGCTAGQIKERILRFMTTFNQASDATVIETRPRSYSQENLRNDEMLETKTMSFRGAMS